MDCGKAMGWWRPFVMGVLAVSATASEPQVEYFKDGDVGVFAAMVSLSKDVDLATTTFSAKSTDDRIYLLYVDSPQRLHEHAVMMGPEELALQPEEQARIDQLKKQQKEPHPFIVSYEYSRRLEGLQELLKDEEARGEDGDATFIARAREKIKDVEARIEEGEAERYQSYDRWPELNQEILEIQRVARERLRQRVAKGPVRIYGRFQGAGKPTLTVLGRSSEQLLSHPQPVAMIKLDLPITDGGNDALLGQWARAQATYFGRYAIESPFSSYYQFCLLQSVDKYGLAQSALPRTLREEIFGRRDPDLYSITTGALAIQESLQLEAMTGRRTVPDDRSVPLTSLRGPKIKSHPFKEMLQGRIPKTSPIAALVPYDAYYCRFASISKQIETSDLLKQWGTSLLRTLTVSARDSDLPSKYQEQLCIGVSLLTRLFGDMVIGEIALTGGDPFLKEGSDLTAIIRVKDRTVFDQQMKAYIDDALAKNRDAQSATSAHEGVDILSVTTPDRRISSHSAYLGDYKVYSNSLGALRRVIDTQAGRRMSMANNSDFLYLRTVFPIETGGGSAAEDGFLYFSDALIRKLIGPRWKIEAQRRIVCQNHLRMITNAATMYRAELRKKPEVKTLVREHYLSDEALRCPDGGAYTIDPSGRAACSVHNRLRYCTPVDSIELSKVSKEEAQEYKAFVSNYNRYWSKYFDPIGIRFKVGHRVEVETCILPLIENSLYNDVRVLVGGEPNKLASRLLTDHTIVAVAAKLDLDQPKYRDKLGELQRTLFPSVPPISDAVGSSFSINLCDSDVLFTLSEREMGMIGWGGLEEQLILATILSSINLPAYAVLELKDDALAQTIMGELLKVELGRPLAQAGPGFWNWVEIEHYASGTHNRHPINTLTVQLFVIKFRLHYAIASNRLIVSTKRYVLQDVLDALDKEDSAGASDLAANVHVDIRPRAFDQLRTVAAVGWQERMRHACLKNLVPIRALIEYHGASVDTVAAVSRRIDGVTPRCPANGAYQYDAARDLVYCTVHGDHRHPRQKHAPTGREPLIQFLRRLQNLSVTLRFTDEGIMTKVAFDLEPTS